MAPGQVTQAWSPAPTYPPTPPTGLFEAGVNIALGGASGPYVYVAGTRELDPGNFQLFVAKYDYDGGLVDEALWPGVDNDTQGMRVLRRMHLLDSEFNPILVVTGETPGLNGSIDVVTVAFNPANLDQKWDRVFSHDPCDDSFYSDDIPVDVRADLQYVVVTGFTLGSCGASPADWFTVAYDAKDGAPVFERILTSAGAADDTPVGVRIVAGRVVVGGTITTGTARQTMAVAYDLNSVPPGQTAWTSPVYTEAGRHVDAVAMEVGGLNGFALYLTCTSRPFTPGGTNADAVTVKYDVITGQFGWTPTVAARFNGAINGDDEPAAIDACIWKPFATNSYHVWVGGFTSQAGTGRDFLVLCYDDLGATFNTLVQVSRDGNLSGDDRAMSIAAYGGALIDGSRAYVTGRRTDASGNAQDFMTGKCKSALFGAMTQDWPFFYPIGGSASTDVAVSVSWIDVYTSVVTGVSNGGASADNCVSVRYNDATP